MSTMHPIQSHLISQTAAYSDESRSETIQDSPPALLRRLRAAENPSYRNTFIGIKFLNGPFSKQDCGKMSQEVIVNEKPVKFDPPDRVSTEDTTLALGAKRELEKVTTQGFATVCVENAKIMFERANGPRGTIGSTADRGFLHCLTRK